ncbi:hypothetical protein PSN45_001556 [Yamadazyma tenuis]|uniref:Uncharacterized protein n=1 Tax=Candida tenuis (strain ATCC 10573 / BCRC 21748 / CBS 615 / JCM 9827 / NBRC 10315 / NRRL Y-1498 / VKM Y-70) TaxID=590646 RepID=G3BFE9_CANTC|nr:uncharacterized protein CANTEDRAFT_96118 [Yamadazyma tenuis ATCC 10573]EGV60672.1 hypothetical protein CANTEDRAFT_96118 [Yamadazyma tenuis ATCC 10573]WEJ94077.1 hypothetical protein PSN45_001556 [Yamadazyma tenuis]
MNIQNHYHKRRALDALEEQDADRKQLIRLAVMHVIGLSQRKTGSAPVPSGTSEDLNQKCLNYELSINKLKQEWNTKDKINEATIDKLKQEIAKLKQQLKRPGSSQGSSNLFYNTKHPQLKPQTSLSYSTSPYLSRALDTKSFLSPTLNSLNKTTVRNPLLVSPIQNTERRGKYMTSNTMKQLQVPKRQTKPTRSILETPTKGLYDPPSPNKSPSRMSFVENFDKSDSSNDESGYGTLFNGKVKLSTTSSRKVSNNEGKENILMEEKEGPDANSTSIMGDDSENITVITANSNVDSSNNASEDEEYASANSTVAGASNTSGKRKQSKRLNFAESRTQSLSQGLNLDQDGANSLDYYKEGNFAEGADESPNFKTKASTSTTTTFEKKKRRVFKIT